MKKNLLIGLAATALLAGCSNNEVLEVLPQEAIGFDAFVDKSTRADVTTADISNFYVYGSYTNGANTANVFDNVTVTKSGGEWNYTNLQYWVENGAYKFAAYANGSDKIESNIAYDNGTGVLAINNYKVGTNDLIYATATATGPAAGIAQDVDFTFNHLLSKVKFTITSSFAENLTVTISNLKINSANHNTVASYNGSAWSGWATHAEITYAHVTTSTTGESSEEHYVIPQDNTNITANFTVTVTDAAGTIIASKTFNATPIATSYTDGSETRTAWRPGYSYNYTATVDASNVEPTAAPIKFTANVTPWETDENVSVAPTVTP